LVGTDLPLLEGLAQSFAGLGFSPTVVQSLTEARDVAAHNPPLVALVGGALVLYRSVGSMLVTFSASVQRAVLADLTLPLERNRLVALVQHVEQRAKAAGRSASAASNEEVAQA